jgi:hypothetical protein
MVEGECRYNGNYAETLARTENTRKTRVLKPKLGATPVATLGCGPRT